MDPQAAPKPKLKKPIAGFIVVLALATFVGVWLYVDAAKNELERKAASPATDAGQAQADAEATSTPPVEEEQWQTYAAEAGGHRVQFDLPLGYRVAPSTADIDALYVMPDSSLEGELPAMQIYLTDPEYSKETATFRVVRAPDGTAYGLALWEDMEWEPFARVVASFKVLQ